MVGVPHDVNIVDIAENYRLQFVVFGVEVALPCESVGRCVGPGPAIEDHHPAVAVEVAVFADFGDELFVLWLSRARDSCLYLPSSP